MRPTADPTINPFDDDEEPWLAQATPTADLALDVYFVVHETFFTGDNNNVANLNDPAFRVPLYRPRYPTPRLTTDVVVRDVGEMIAYYRDVLAQAQRFGRDLRRERYYFWLRPLLWNDQGVCISFPWYDTQEEAENFMVNLGREDDGELYWDADQGWELTVVGRGERLYLYNGNLDTGKAYFQVWCDRQKVRSQIFPVAERLAAILGTLRREFGRDYWSRPA